MADSTKSKDQFILNPEGFGTAAGTPVANIFSGGQNGVGFNPEMFDASTPAMWPPAIIYVLKTPQMYRDDKNMSMAIKALFEIWPKEFTGIDIAYTFESERSKIGTDGQEQSVPTRTTRASVTPNIVVPEIGGAMMWNIIRRWGTDTVSADTHMAMEFAENPEQWAMSAWSVSFLAIQPDPSHLAERMIDAAFFTNVHPQQTGELGLERRVGQSTIKERSFPFNGIQIHNEQTRALGRSMLEKLNLRRAKYAYMSPGVTDVDGLIADAGISKSMEDILNNIKVS